MTTPIPYASGIGFYPMGHHPMTMEDLRVLEKSFNDSRDQLAARASNGRYYQRNLINSDADGIILQHQDSKAVLEVVLSDKMRAFFEEVLRCTNRLSCGVLAFNSLPKGGYIGAHKDLISLYKQFAFIIGVSSDHEGGALRLFPNESDQPLDLTLHCGDVAFIGSDILHQVLPVTSQALRDSIALSLGY